MLQAARIWVIATLGRFWTTRVITVPEAPLIRRGQYCYLRHPNYLVVVGEMAVNQDRAEPAVRKQRRGIFILAKRVVAISEIGVCENVEGSFDVGKVSGF